MAKQQAFQRRRPRQARARITYDSILEAAVQVLERSGPDGLNTNAVAERAGVSIGTLYQYFPGKEAILLAVARREIAAPRPGIAAVLLDALARMLESLLGGDSVPVRRGARRNPAIARSREVASKMEALLDWLMPLPAPMRLHTRVQPSRSSASIGRKRVL
ncbi:MAG: helix-turn-helix domain-containing protein [Rhizomicrobium sp.]